MLNLVLGIALPALFGGIVLINLRAHFKSVKYFSNDGIMRNDGRNFAWSELHRVITQTRIKSANGHRQNYLAHQNPLQKRRISVAHSGKDQQFRGNF
ncbi:MAG: hypothetical protein ABJA66_12155 [Actinomycetota bacterium]